MMMNAILFCYARVLDNDCRVYILVYNIDNNYDNADDDAAAADAIAPPPTLPPLPHCFWLLFAHSSAEEQNQEKKVWLHMLENIEMAMTMMVTMMIRNTI